MLYGEIRIYNRLLKTWSIRTLAKWAKIAIVISRGRNSECSESEANLRPKRAKLVEK